MSYSLFFELPGLPKGMNGSHGHWRTAAAERKKWRVMSCAAATRKKLPLAGRIPLKECSILCTRYSSSEPDHDNLVASFKPILDGLKDAGVIEDDRSSCVKQREYKWVKASPKKGKVSVEVREL